MKKIFQSVVAFCVIVLWASCVKHDYAEGQLSPIISIERLRLLHKTEDVVLTAEKLASAKEVGGTVISNHAGMNLPEGMVVMQSERGGRLRGIALSIGAGASGYLPGDSINVNIEGATLSRDKGVLQVKGLSASSIRKIDAGKRATVRTASALMLKNTPSDYESCLVSVYGCNFNPDLGVEKLAGTKAFSDGLGEAELHVEPTSDLANTFLPYTANVTGIIFNSESGVMQIWPGTKADFIATSIIVDPSVPLGKNPAIITGYLFDPTGSDGNYEYMQFMATQDIDFLRTPFSVITTNNAGSSTPVGFPLEGWVTGDLRTYKFNITKGTVAKGSFFYVGGYKKIWGANSTDISSANWAASVLYLTEPGADGIGSPTGGLFANSGNAAGIAIFKTTNVTKETVPCDVIFYGGNGNLYSAGPPAVGYRLIDNDLYDTKNGSQPFINQGTNTKKFAFPTAGAYAKFGGVYNSSTQSWTTARVQTSVPLGNTSTITLLETGSGTTQLSN